MQLNLAGSSYTDLTIEINNQRCINWFVAPSGEEGVGGQDPTAEYTRVLKPTPGTLLLIDCGGSTTRKQITIRNKTYMVVDNKIYQITINALTLISSKTLIGSINTSSGKVKIAYSDTEIIWVDGQDGWLFNDGTSTFTQITDVDFPNCRNIVYIAGYFFAEEIDTGKVFNSALNDGSTWTALGFFTASTNPDYVSALATTKEELWVIGDTSMEPWFNEGNLPPGSPFSLRVGLSISIGIKAFTSVINVSDSLFWLDSRGYFIQAGNSAYVRDNNTGYNLNIISTPAITEELKTYINTQDVEVCSYSVRGHIMIQWTFPTDNKTWVYDTLTKKWHENLFYNTTLASFEYCLFEHASEYNELTLVSGSRSGKLYVLSINHKDNDGVLIRRQRTTPFLYVRESVKFITINRLFLQMGVLNFPVVGDYQELHIGLKYSRDGGHTWSALMWRTVNLYDEIVSWNLLGTGRKWVFSFEVSDPIDASILDAWIEVEVQK